VYHINKIIMESILRKRWVTFGIIAFSALWTWCMGCSFFAVFEYSTIFTPTLRKEEICNKYRPKSMWYSPYRYIHKIKMKNHSTFFTSILSKFRQYSHWLISSTRTSSSL
jgi:hypothetical protein